MKSKRKSNRNAANDLISRLQNSKNNTYFIHYSCQSFDDSNDSLSPRITSIAILHYQSSQMFSFSIHLSAEQLKIKEEDIECNLDKIEKDMLCKLNNFMLSHVNNIYWIHWNMKDIYYGFEALEHRYSVLTQKTMVHIPEENRFNLSDILFNKYGNFAKDPKMENLMRLNRKDNTVHRNFLSGEDEATAFQAKHYRKMHNSTMCKVRFFERVLDKAYDNELRTETNQFRYFVNELYKNPFMQLLSIIGIIGSVVSLILQCIRNS